LKSKTWPTATTVYTFGYMHLHNIWINPTAAKQHIQKASYYVTFILANINRDIEHVSLIKCSR